MMKRIKVNELADRYNLHSELFEICQLHVLLQMFVSEETKVGVMTVQIICCFMENQL